MANPNAPFGFADSHRLGAAVNYQMSRRWILAGNSTPIYAGDPIVQLSTGYVTQATPSAVQVGGIFIGCEYMSISQRKWVASNWWPGNGDAAVSGTGFDVQAKIIDDPLTVFRVQANGMPTGVNPGNVIATIGMNAQFALGVSVPQQQATGRSGATIDVITNAPAATATFPFRIVDVVRDPPGGPGTDITSPYYWYYVTFNNQDYKSLTGI
jgi:hypothetical protein